jgi:hypothetical protein
MNKDSDEYDCVECGRHIISVGFNPRPFCAACLTIPGWFRDLEMRRAIDPQGWAKPPEEAIHGDFPPGPSPRRR